MLITLPGAGDRAGNESPGCQMSYTLFGALYSFVIYKITLNLFESMCLSCHYHLGCTLSLWNFWLNN